MPNKLVTDPEQVTAHWLNTILRGNGHMPHGEIATLTRTVARPFMSAMVSIHVTYGEPVPPNLPTDFLLKMDGPNSLAEGREAQFYEQFTSNNLQAITAPCFDAVYDSAQ